MEKWQGAHYGRDYFFLELDLTHKRLAKPVSEQRTEKTDTSALLGFTVESIGTELKSWREP